MGGALAQGVVESGIADPANITVVDRQASHLETFQSTLGVTTMTHVDATAADSDMIILAVKPHDAMEACQELAPNLQANTLVVSIVAGLSLSILGEEFPSNVALARVMPNVPVIVRAGVSALCTNDNVNAEQLRLVESVFGAVGTVVEIPERHFDVVTALSASGPAYLFLVAEALIDAAVALGLMRQDATILTYNTMAGAARLLMEDEAHVATHRARVVSPGGTTAAGLAALEARATRAAFYEALKAATARSLEMADEFSRSRS